VRPRELMYGVLALLGLGLTGYFNVQHIAGGGSFPDFFRLGFANAAVSSWTLDTLVAFIAFAVWAVIEGKRLEMRGAWLYPALGVITAFAFVFPLFLMFRERRLRVQA
jgi:hypothetical protein